MELYPEGCQERLLVDPITGRFFDAKPLVVHWVFEAEAHQHLVFQSARWGHGGTQLTHLTCNHRGPGRTQQDGVTALADIRRSGDRARHWDAGGVPMSLHM